MADVKATPRVSPRPSMSPGGPNTAKSVGVSDEAIALQVQQFLDDWHYRLMNCMGKKVQGNQATKFALEILALNGVNLTESEIKSLSKNGADESLLVQTLVPKLPMAMREDFDHLALQLQMLVTTTARVRRSIEDGAPETMQETIEEVDGTSIGQQILKQAVVQASREVAAIHRCQDTWYRSMEKRLDRLTRSAELAEHAQQQLIAVETQLQRFGTDQNEKSKKALMGFADGNDKSLLHSVFSSWLGIILAFQGERAIKRKYEKEIADAEKALYDFKEKQLRCVKGQLMSSARESDEGLLHYCVNHWSAEIKENKRLGVNKHQMMELEAKLQKFQSSNSDNTRKVMQRMGADRDANVQSLAWSAWLTFSQDYKKDKEFEDKVKATEQRLNEHMKKKKEDAKLVLDRMNGATQSGLMAMCIQNWYQFIQEGKKTKALEEKMANANGNFKSMQLRQKGNAMSVQGRTNEQIKANLILRCFSAWTLETKVNHVDRYYSNKMSHKRQQLSSVQTLFKSFAKQLEEGLGNIEGPTTGTGDSSGRGLSRRSKPGMAKDGNSVSLPDIHARPTPA